MPVVGQPSITGFTVQQTTADLFEKDEIVRAIVEAVKQDNAERRAAEKVEEEARIAVVKAAKAARKAEEKAELGEKHGELMLNLDEIKKKNDVTINKLTDELRLAHKIIAKKDKIIAKKDAINAKKDEDNANLCHELWRAHGKMGAYRNEAGKDTRAENKRVSEEIKRVSEENKSLRVDKEETQRYNALLHEENARLKERMEQLSCA
jgi:hypothetical protein